MKIIKKLGKDSPKRLYKRPYAAVYKILCTKNKKVYIAGSHNADHSMRDILVRLRAGTCHNSWLQSDFTKYGEAKFKFSIIVRWPAKEWKKFKGNEKYLLVVEETKKWKIKLRTNEFTKGYNTIRVAGEKKVSEASGTLPNKILGKGSIRILKRVKE